jgi:hypothetical protein
MELNIRHGLRVSSCGVLAGRFHWHKISGACDFLSSLGIFGEGGE